MMVIERICMQVQSAEVESKIVSQYSDLVQEAKQQFQKEVSSLTPEIQANWKGLSESDSPSSSNLDILVPQKPGRLNQLNGCRIRN